MLQPRTISLLSPWLLFVGLAPMSGRPAMGEEPDSASHPLATMKAQIETVHVAVEAKPAAVAARLREEPVFRYSDPVRQFPDATVWVWEVERLPVAICKLERVGVPSAGWQYCFVSLSDQIVSATWSDRFTWRAREPGIQWRAVPDASPKETDAARQTQLRQLARSFTGVIRNPQVSRQETMRLLPTPLLRYGDANGAVGRGALFGLTSNGTNPDALLLLQLAKSAAGQDEWRYGMHGLTGDEVEVRLRESVVHAQPYTGVPGNHGTWMWIVFFDDGGVAP
jgi:hypothetical protein